jgi:hypothetical protein
MNSIHSGRGWPITCLNSGIGAPGEIVLAAPLMRFPPCVFRKARAAHGTGEDYRRWRKASNNRMLLRRNIKCDCRIRAQAE